MGEHLKIERGRTVSESGENLCNVCHEVVNIFAIGECDHPICFKCSTRMRILCNQSYCAICRTDMPKVAFTRNYVKFQKIDLAGYRLHQKYRIFFENEEVKMSFFEIQEHCCSVCQKRKVLPSFHLLAEHMRKEHSLFPCQLCVDHIKIFSQERKFYDRKKLGEHRRLGDHDDRSHKGHPLCQFCDERYFDNDELVRHLRKDHYFCHFCDSDGISNEFYSEYSNLRQHFVNIHFTCEENECANLQFTNAFRNELDLKAHKAAFHSKNLKKAMSKTVRTLNLDFNLAPRNGMQGRTSSKKDAQDQAGKEKDVLERRNPGGNSRRKESKQERRQKKIEDDEFQRAITASLNSATAVSVVDPNLLTYTKNLDENDQTLEQNGYNRDVTDFPLLGNSAQNVDFKADNLNSDCDSQNLKDNEIDSFSQKISQASGFSVQHGSMKDEDFPMLGGRIWTSDSKLNMETKKNATVEKLYEKKNQKLNVEVEDFPELMPIKTNKNKISGKAELHYNASWSEKTKGLNSSNDKKKMKPIKSFGRNPSKSAPFSKKSNPEFSPQLSSDFPSLSDISHSLSNQPVQHKSAHRENDKQKFHVEDDSRMVNVKKTSKKKIQNPDTYHTYMEPCKSENLFKSYDHSGISVKKKSNSTYTGKHLTSKQPENEFVASVDHNLCIDKANDVTLNKKKSKKQNINGKVTGDIANTNGQNKQKDDKNFEAESFSRNDPSIKDVKNVPKKHKVQSNLVDITYETECDPVDNLNSKHDISVDQTDSFGFETNKPSAFYELSLINSGPPPGFSNTISNVHRLPPPGFSNTSTNLSDIASLLTNVTNVVDKGAVATGQNTVVCPPQTITSSDNIKYEFIKPIDFQERNQKLINEILNCLDGNEKNFNEFKIYSSEFRKGLLCASDYYFKCLNMLGKSNFLEIFNELLLLLPDIDKQQQLLEVSVTHSETSSNEKRERKICWKTVDSFFFKCYICKQVILEREEGAHLVDHNTAEDFPLLKSTANNRN